MSKKEWVLTKEMIDKEMKSSDRNFDLLWNVCNGAVEMFQINNMTSYSVSMAMIEAILKDGKKNAAPKTMTLLCDLMIKLADEYSPDGIKKSSAEPTLTMVEACQKVWGMSRDEALEWLGSDAGVYIPMGGEVRWMSGAAIKSLLEKVSR